MALLSDNGITQIFHDEFINPLNIFYISQQIYHSSISSSRTSRKMRAKRIPIDVLETQCIWNSKCILEGNSGLYYSHLSDKGIYKIADILNDSGKLL